MTPLKSRAHDEDDDYEDALVEGKLENDQHTTEYPPLKVHAHDEDDYYEDHVVIERWKTMIILLMCR